MVEKILPVDATNFLLSPEGFLLREDVISWAKWTAEQAWYRRYGLPSNDAEVDDHLNLLFGTFPEFRSLFDYRAKTIQGLPGILKAKYPRASELYIQAGSIGPRFRIQHGQNTIILARSIGTDFFINHNVTVGSHRGIPTIGSNVSVRTGAVVVGPISIGNDVTITANAVVSTDVADHTIAYAPRTIFKRKTPL